MGHLLANSAIGIYMRWVKTSLRAPLLQAARHSEHVQASLLREILRDNANTSFGLEHGFSEIPNLEVYRQRVPVQTYDQLEASILDQQGGALALTSAEPRYYARTSGTTGRSKFIPLTVHGLKQVRDAQRHLALTLWSDTDFFKGAVLGLASPIEEGRLENGKPFGSTSGSTYRSLSPVIAGKFIVPHATFAVADVEAKYEVYAMATLSSDDITGVVAANPSSILKIVSCVEARASEMIDALLTGDTSRLRPEAGALVPELSGRANRSRLKKLQTKLRTNGRLSEADVWPRLSAIATWTGGSCGVALRRLRQHLPKNVKVVEYGYGASEFMGSVNVEATTNLCLPLVNDHVYEFVRRVDWEAGRMTFLGLHEVERGEDYYIFITTRSGLYRYNINDIVRVDRGVGQTPSLQFLQKGRGVTSITGEKLSEDQLISAVEEALGAASLVAESYLALADEEASRYELFLECSATFDPETLATAIDNALRAKNLEYDDKRASERLRRLRLKLFRTGAGETIKRWSVERGVREAQYKPTLLDYHRNWSEKLSALVPETNA